MKKLNKTNITKVLIEIQDKADIVGNSLATKAIEDFGLEKEYEKLEKARTKLYNNINKDRCSNGEIEPCNCPMH